jgi:dethiobiotin synthetase
MMFFDDKRKINKVKIPKTKNSLIVEGAGGVLVPLNQNLFVLDLIKYFELEVVLVSNDYLGSINHTLLTIEVLKKNNIKIKGIVFNNSISISVYV